MRKDAVEKLHETLGPSLYPWLDETNWEKVEGDLGVRLPSDYKRLVGRYSGMYITGLTIASPRWNDKDSSIRSLSSFTQESKEIFLERHERAKMRGKDLMKLFEDSSPSGFSFDENYFRFYPEVPGLLRWGSDWDGADYFWRVDGDPDGWPVVAWQVKMDIWVQHDMSMSEYILGCMEDVVDCLVITPSMASEFEFQESPHDRPDGTSVD